jgi:hypothetical protein
VRGEVAGDPGVPAAARGVDQHHGERGEGRRDAERRERRPGLAHALGEQGRAGGGEEEEAGEEGQHVEQDDLLDLHARPQHEPGERHQARVRPPRAVPHRGELRQVRVHLPLVPRGQDRLNVREVLVERGPPDPCLFGDLGHRDRRQPVLGDQRDCGVEDRVAHLASVRLDCLAPQLRHAASIHGVSERTERLDEDILYR